MTLIKAFFDGACEPVNPGGTASYGAVIFKGDKRIWEASEIFYPKKGQEKKTSNNVAEYSGFKAILEYLLTHNLNRQVIFVYGDSKLVIMQMFSYWRIKQGYYVPIARTCKKLLKQFPNIQGQWIPRDENSIADELSKAELVKANVKFKIQPEG